MGPEIVIGILGGSLWKYLSDKAKFKDDEKAIEEALKDAIRIGYEQFSKSHSDLAASLFDRTFLENHIGPELAKYLTRHEHPNIKTILAAYHSQFHSTPPNGLEDAIADFLNSVVQAMKDKSVLQGIIDRREIEETRHLVADVHKSITSPEEDWVALDNASADAVTRIRDDIAGRISLTLHGDKELIDAALKKEGGGIVLLGPSGCGKSALAKRIAMHSRKFIHTPWLTAEILNKPTLLETERALGLHHPFKAVFATAKSNRILLVLDAMESLTTQGISNLSQVIRAVKESDANSIWSFLLISQPEGWDQLAFQLSKAGILLDNFNIIQASGPSKQDVQYILSCIPGLSPVAYRPSVSDKLTNLKLLDQVAGQAILKPPVAEITWTSVAEVIDWVWDGWMGSGRDRYARAEVLKTLGQCEADSFGRGIAISDLSAEQQIILVPLADEEKLIEVRTERAFFRHDSTADWARYRILAGEVPVAPRLRELSAYPKWNTATRLMGQRILDMSDSNGTEWEALLNEVADGSLRGEAAQDLLLDAVILSTNVTTHLDKIRSILMREDGKFLQRLLNRFLHVATIPDQRILLNVQDEKMRHYLATNMRVPIFVYWWSLLDWLFNNLTDVINLSPVPLAKICTAWLRNTPVSKDGEGSWLRRNQVARMALTLAREIQARNLEHSPIRDAEKFAYEAAFLAASEIPDEVAQWALEMANRRPLAPDIIKRQDAYLRKEEERRIQLEADPEYQERIKGMEFLTPLTLLGPLRDPWPEGPTAMVNHIFQKVALDTSTLLNLMATRPELARELILALIIEHPAHVEDSPSSYAWCGLQYFNDGTPAMYFNGPFGIFLHINPKIALDTIIRLVNFAAERFCERQFSNTEVEVNSVKIPFVQGDVIWRGDQRVFGFFRSDLFNSTLLSSALMAIEKWLYEKIEKGENIDEWIGQILSDSQSVAFAGLLLAVGKKEPSLLEGMLLPLLGTWQFYEWDTRLIMNETSFRISMMNWVSHGEKVYNHVLDWHNLPHRRADLYNEALKLLLTSPSARNFFNIVYHKWTTDEETREATKFIAERFNPKNFELKKGVDGEHMELHFQWPDHLKEESSTYFKKSENEMLLLTFPVRCRRILDGEVSLPITQLDEFWSHIQYISELDVQEIEIDRKSQRADAICGGIAVLLIDHLNWLTEFPEREEWCIKYVFETLSKPPQHSQFDFENSISGTYWDASLGEVGALLLAEEPSNENIRFIAAHGVIAYHEEATESTISRAFRLREKLGEEFTRLLNLSLLWATLKYIRPREFPGPEAITWETWVNRLFGGFVAGRIQFKPVSIRRLARAGSRLYERQYHQRQRKRYPQYQPRHLHCNPGIDTSLLRKSLSWIRDAEMNDPHLPAGLIDDICLALSEFSISMAVPEDNEYNVQRSIPTDFDQWVFDVLSSCIIKTATPKESSKFWKPIFDIGPQLHLWPKFFLMSWFRTGLQSAGSPEAFTPHWTMMIAYVLEHPLWASNASRHYHDSEEVLCHLMGMDSAISIIGKSSFKEILESLLPLYDNWRKHWLQGQHSFINFCRLLTYSAARPLRIIGVIWIRDVLMGENYFSTREEDIEKALLGMLHTIWDEHQKIVQQDSGLREAFLDILTWLVQRQNPGALELQDEYIRSK
jgi:hypothetical protein